MWYKIAFILVEHYHKNLRNNYNSQINDIYTEVIDRPPLSYNYYEENPAAKQ